MRDALDGPARRQPSLAPSIPSSDTTPRGPKRGSSRMCLLSRRSSRCCAMACSKPTSTADTVGVIVDFFDNLGPARSAIDQYFGDANHIGTERASALHLIGLSSSWQPRLRRRSRCRAPTARLPRTAAVAIHEQLQGPHRVAAKRGARRLPLSRRERQDRHSRPAAAAPVSPPHDLPAVHDHLQSHDRAGIRP